MPVQVSITLFESLVILVITGIFVVAWWGIKRMVNINDDEAKALNEINKSLSAICGRLEKADMWAKMHTKQDDERHERIMQVQEELRDAMIVLGNKIK